MGFNTSKIKYAVIFGAFLAASLLSLGSCSSKKPDLPVNVEEVHITIPEMENEVKLAFLSDLHIVTMSDEIADDQEGTIIGRTQWSSYEGVSAKDQLPGWIDTLNETKADYVLFGGDMVDFSSDATTDILKDGLKNLKIPYMYVRADHDTTPSYIDKLTINMGTEYQEKICEMSDVFVKEFPDFCIVGWNNSTSPLTVAGMETIRDAAQHGKPMILLTHVPIAPKEDISLSQKSEEEYGGRILLWGESSNFSYFPNNSPEGGATAELLDMLYSEDSPFVEVLCGHLHFSWDGNITEQVHQHVFSAAFNRYMGIVTVSGN